VAGRLSTLSDRRARDSMIKNIRPPACFLDTGLPCNHRSLNHVETSRWKPSVSIGAL
jgi:hypothetical protein